MNEFSTTFSSAIEIQGIGLHTGAKVCMRILPAPIDHGIVFERVDVRFNNRIPALAKYKRNTTLCTEIVNGAGVSVSTIEHLMAAFHAIGITDALVQINGLEVPILDGSSKDYIQSFIKARSERRSIANKSFVLKRRIKVVSGSSWAILTPNQNFKVSVELDFPHKIIGKQCYSLTVNPISFVLELSNARTFALLKDVEAIKAMGMGKGGNLSNTIVLDDNKVLNPGGLRYWDEFARHKALDAIGDLYLLGCPLKAHYDAYKPGHTLNACVVDRLLEEMAEENQLLEQAFA